MEWSKSSFELHPEGVFKMVFVNWSEENGERFGKQVKLEFDTEEQDSSGKPFRIFAFTKPSLHEKGKVSRMLKAFGFDTEEMEPESFDLDDYLNLKCNGVIEHYKGEAGEPRHKITNFLPLKKAKPQVAPQAKPQDEPERELVGAGAGKGSTAAAFADDDD